MTRSVESDDEPIEAELSKNDEEKIDDEHEILQNDDSNLEPKQKK